MRSSTSVILWKVSIGWRFCFFIWRKKFNPSIFLFQIEQNRHVRIHAFLTMDLFQFFCRCSELGLQFQVFSRAKFEVGEYSPPSRMWTRIHRKRIKSRLSSPCHWAVLNLQIELWKLNIYWWGFMHGYQETSTSSWRGEWGVGRESSAFQFLLVAKLAELVHRILKEFSYLLWTKEIRHQRLHTHESEDPHGLSHHLPRP